MSPFVAAMVIAGLVVNAPAASSGASPAEASSSEASSSEASSSEAAASEAAASGASSSASASGTQGDAGLECERLCLAPVSSIGMDPDERSAVEAALVRALDAPRCAQPIVVDDVCFGDDACVQKASSQPFIAVRAVRAGSELRLTWAAKKPAGITRGEHVAAAITFYASGALDHDVAKGACKPLDGRLTRTTTTTTLGGASTPARDGPAAMTSSTMPSAPFIAIVAGATVATVSLVVLTVAAAGLESADTDGATKETAFTAGWIAMGGVVVGAGVGAVGVFTLE